MSSSEEGRSHRAARLLLLMAAMVATVGCGFGGKSTGKVNGKVLYRGQPVAHGNVNFYMKERGVAAVGSIDGSGAYTVALPMEPGTYAVRITPPTPEPGTADVRKRYPDIPMKYREDSTSGLSLTVKPGTNEFVIDMVN